MKTSSLLASFSVAAALLALAAAREEYVSRVPNGANVDGVAAVGHVATSGGGARNAFGSAFEDAGLKWTKALCEADSDGDGATNGQELGDPCCTWTVGATPQFTAGVSAPGDASSTASSSLWAGISCGASSTTPSTSTSTPSTPSTTTTAPPPASSGASSVSVAVAASVAAAVVAAFGHL